MKKLKHFIFITLILFWYTPLFAAEQLPQEEITKEALNILQGMSLKEKIGQKLMFDFRYWCPTTPPNNQTCLQDLTTINPTIAQIISANHIGGIILFSNNLKDIAQITTLIDAFQQTMRGTHNQPLLIGTDQEGGIVARLPRDISVSFPGNMAIAAAYLGNPMKNYSADIGKIIATDLKAVGINIDFAPDVDVNSNPLNPVIHVRAFSDDPELVSKLGLELSKAIQAEGIAATLKHFPGHGDTVTDSHVGLPVVGHDSDQAWKIDLFPFKYIIDNNAPDLIMTAHIQYPALDNTEIYASKTATQITIPATFSRHIQYDLLRTQLAYQGVIITDAMNMDAIVQNFDSTDATLKAFQAGSDIVLMPIQVSTPQEAGNVANLISTIESAILNGTLSISEVDQSVLRVLKLKIKLGLLHPDPTHLPEKITRAQKIFSDKGQYELESAITNDAITLVQNVGNLVPITLLPNTRIHILTPWSEQGAGIAAEITHLMKENLLPQNLQINFSKIADTNLTAEKLAVDNADIVIVGNNATKSAPLTNDQLGYQVLHYAKVKHKKTIFISLLAPYDLPNYKDVADVMLVGYDYYGYLTDQTHSYYRGPSTQALTRVIFGITPAKGKLPINIPNPNQPNEIIFSRGSSV